VHFARVFLGLVDGVRRAGQVLDVNRFNVKGGVLVRGTINLLDFDSNRAVLRGEVPCATPAFDELAHPTWLSRALPEDAPVGNRCDTVMCHYVAFRVVISYVF
jgi:hypothetical protein